MKCRYSENDYCNKLNIMCVGGNSNCSNYEPIKEVCEWRLVKLPEDAWITHLWTIDCRGETGCGGWAIADFKVCPYCGKKITIKGE